MKLKERCIQVWDNSNKIEDMNRDQELYCIWKAGYYLKVHSSNPMSYFLRDVSEGYIAKSHIRTIRLFLEISMGD